MKELSLHLLDLVENSIRAKATHIILSIAENTTQDLLEIVVEDDGEGMDEWQLERVWDPFFSGQNKKVGMGIPLFAQVVEQCQGKVTISSQKGRGTRLRATMQRSHIDCPPLGNIPETLTLLVITHPEIRWEFAHLKDGQGWFFKSDEFFAQWETKNVYSLYTPLREWFQNRENNLGEGNHHEN